METKSAKRLIKGIAIAGLAASGWAARMAAAADSSQTPVTFSKDIAPILQAKCQECHRPNELAPMSLLTYADTRPWAKSIKKAVAQRDMPPWDADPSIGKFENDFSLTQEEIEKVSAWVDQGAPEGNPADLPAPRQWPADGWNAGEPDLVLSMKAPYVVPVTARNEDIYQCIVLPTGLDEEMWFSGIEYHPGNKRVVHHIIAFLDLTGEALKKDLETPEPGFVCGMGGGGGKEGGKKAGSLASQGIDAMIGGWAPGVAPNIFHDDIGKLLPKGANIVLQMHYHNETGAEQKDITSLGIHFSHKTVQYRARIMPVSAWNINIPAGDPNAEHRAQWRVPKDIDLRSLMPHMHYIGKDMTLSAEYPDGREEKLIFVPKFDFNWQTVYILAEAKRIPKGSLIKMVSHHDNSPNNPANPSKPPIDVKWGESTTEEMAIGWLGYTIAGENLNIPPKPFKPIGSATPEKNEKKVSAK